MRTKRIIYALCGLVAVTLASACSSKEFDEPAAPDSEVYTYTLNLDLDFKGTPDESDTPSRAAMESLPDGAQIFMSFHPGEQVDAGNFTSHEPALAKYNAEKNEWTLYTTTVLQANTFGCATIYYFGSEVAVEGTTFETINIPATAPVYCGVARYTMLGPNSLNMQATLKPEGMRVRFKYSSALSNPVDISELICPTRWISSYPDDIYYQDFPQITPSQWTENGGAYYTPYYTIRLYDYSNECFFRLYCADFDSSTRVRLFTFPNDYSSGNTYTVDLDQSWARIGAYSSWTFSDISLNYANQESPGKDLSELLTSGWYVPSKVGIHVEAKYTVTGLAPEGVGYSRWWGFLCKSYDTYDYIEKTAWTTFKGSQEVGDNATIRADFFNPDLNENYTNYYKVYLTTDGANITFTDIKISTFSAPNRKGIYRPHQDHYINP